MEAIIYVLFLILSVVILDALTYNSFSDLFNRRGKI